MARSARLAKPEVMPTRFEGGDRGQVHWTCGLGSLNRGAQRGNYGVLEILRLSQRRSALTS
jgi:hypothetical protein